MGASKRSKNPSTRKSHAVHLSAASELIRQAKDHHRAGRLPAAEAIYQRVLTAEPNNADALHFLGLLSHQRGNGAAAVDLMYRAVAAKPDAPEYHSNLGMVLGLAGRAEEALDVLDQALRLKPEYPEAHDNRGLVLERMGKTDEAVECWRRALAIRPDFATSHGGLGRALLAKGQVEEAISHLREAIRLNPRAAEAYNSLGCALRKTGDPEEALKAFRQAVRLAPAPEMYCNLGTVFFDLGRPREAVGPIEKAVELRADYVDAHWNLALSLLALGEFDRGWPEYEWRSHLANLKPQERAFVQPPWNGCSVAGRNLLVICEQGLGDTLQFIRYVPLLAARGAKVIVECQPALRELLGCVKGIDQIVARGEPLPRFDTHVKIMSLPGIFGTRLGNVPADVPYLFGDPAAEARRKPQLAGEGFKIGVAWQGNPDFPGDAARSIGLTEFEPVAAIKGVKLYSLQKNAGTEQIAPARERFNVEEFGPPLDEQTGAFVETGAVMSQLDLVVTSDTAIAHLAGGLGVRVWVALGVASDWRWLRDREDSPWYPTMRLFRQEERGDWKSVFARMAVALRDTLDATPVEEAPAVLAPVAPGELLDRLTILQIKAQRLTDPLKLKTVRVELEALAAVREKALPHSEQLDLLARELRVVNETLWQIEDDIRSADREGEFGPRFVELARSVYRTNDRRSDLKRQINILLRSAIREEKHYQAHNH